MNKHIYRT